MKMFSFFRVIKWNKGVTNIKLCFKESLAFLGQSNPGLTCVGILVFEREQVQCGLDVEKSPFIAFSQIE